MILIVLSDVFLGRGQFEGTMAAFREHDKREVRISWPIHAYLCPTTYPTQSHALLENQKLPESLRIDRKNWIESLLWSEFKMPVWRKQQRTYKAVKKGFTLHFVNILNATLCTSPCPDHREFGKNELYFTPYKRLMKYRFCSSTRSIGP